jgi:tetratricopeptide (TPR) repeat protein
VLGGAWLWNLALVQRPRTLVAAGKWPEARAAARRLEMSWLRLFGGVVDASRYTRALCYHLEGRFEESQEVLARVRNTKAMAYAARTLEAGNLLFLGRDHERVEALLREAKQTKELPEDVLLLAIAKLGLGKREEAEQCFARAGTKRAPDLDGPLINEPAFHYLRALYLLKTGRAEQSLPDLQAAAHAIQASIYVKRARQLLPGGESEDEPPTSLDAQILGG